MALKPKTVKAARRARRRGEPGFLGMEELAKLSAEPPARCDSCNRGVWSLVHVGAVCLFPQLAGTDCKGLIRATEGQL